MTENLLTSQIAILIMILVGFILAKVKLVNVEFRKYLTDLVIYFILPCNIIKSFMMEFDMQILRACLAVLVVSAITQILTFGAGKLLYLRVDSRKQCSLQYATMVSNAGFLGNPIVEGLFGAQGLLYASVYLIPQRIMMWSVGVTCFTGSKGDGVLKKVLTHPCIVAVGIGLVLMITQLQLPAWLDKPLTFAANCNTALSLIVIGGILAVASPKRMFHKTALYFCAIRLVAIPLIVLAGCFFAGIRGSVLEATTILAGMPAALTTVMLASKYGRDEEFAVSLVFLSTLFSIVTIPALCLLMMAL